MFAAWYDEQNPYQTRFRISITNPNGRQLAGHTSPSETVSSLMERLRLTDTQRLSLSQDAPALNPKTVMAACGVEAGAHLYVVGEGLPIVGGRQPLAYSTTTGPTEQKSSIQPLETQSALDQDTRIETTGLKVAAPVVELRVVKATRKWPRTRRPSRARIVNDDKVPQRADVIYNPDLMKKIIDTLAVEEEFLVGSLVGRPFYSAVKELRPKGWTTSPRGVVQSLERFLWVRGLPDGGPRWLQDWDATTCRVIARHGGLEVLVWLKASGCGVQQDWEVATCDAAAEGGHLAVLQWARENGCEWGATTCTAAAKRGHLEVLKWLRANGCPWEADTCTAAAQGGHLELLQWARDNGCEWTAAACVAAARGGHVEVLTYADGNGCECGGVFHSSYWLGQRAHGLSRLLSCAVKRQRPEAIQEGTNDSHLASLAPHLQILAGG